MYGKFLTDKQSHLKFGITPPKFERDFANCVRTHAKFCARPQPSRGQLSQEMCSSPERTLIDFPDCSLFKHFEKLRHTIESV